MKIKRALRMAGRIAAGFVVFVLLYLLSAFALAHISVSKEPVSAPTRIPIYLVTDGVHTDVVLPIKYGTIDWTTSIKINYDTTAKFLAFGWGDKNFYINTPTWADLKFSTAFKAIFGLGSSAMHIAFYKGLQPDRDYKKLILTEGQYKNLVSFITSSFKLDSTGNFIYIKTNETHYSEAYYDANGSYNLFHTCNTWANDALKSCRQRASLWTVFANGIAYQYRE